jgi:PAS domain S-box-containing protein
MNVDHLDINPSTLKEASTSGDVRISVAAAVLLPVSALLLSRLLFRVPTGDILLLFVLAVCLCAFLGNLLATTLCLLVSLVLVWFSLVLPYGAGVVGPSHLLWAATFSGACLIWASLLESRRRNPAAGKAGAAFAHAILDLVDAGIIVQDADARVVYANQTALKMANLSSHELAAITKDNFQHQFELKDEHGQPMDLRQFPTYRAMREPGEFRATVSLRSIRSGANPVWFDVRSRCLPPTEHHDQVTVSFFRDVTQEQQYTQHDQKMRAKLIAMSRLVDTQRRRLNDIINTIPALIWEGVGDPAEGQRIVFVNRYGEALLGYSLEEWNRAPGAAYAWIHPDDRAHVMVKTRENFRRTVTEPFEFRMLAKDGRVITFEALTIIVYDEANRAIGARGIMMDITARKRAEDELRRSNEDLEHLASVASHDLQEPLRMITSYIQLVQKRYGDRLDAEAHEFMDFAIDGSKRMKRLIGDILHHSRIHSSKDPFTDVDMNQVLAQVLRNLAPMANDIGAVITHDSLPVVQGSAYMLEQLMQNLVSNALKFHDKRPPTVHIGVERQDSRWLFSVKDNGIGIDPEYAQKIFEMFQRGASHTRSSGSGIGLAICRKVIDRHQGQIWVESAKGIGSTFCFTLPASATDTFEAAR